MDLQKFKESYVHIISESNDSELKNYIRSIVEEVVAEKTTKNKLKNRLTEAQDGGPYVDTYPDPDKLPLTMDALYGLSRYDPEEVNILDMIKIPAEYDLEEIEKILVRLKAEKGLTSTQYTDFIEREEDDQNYLTGFTKYQYLLPAEEFFDWVKSGNLEEAVKSKDYNVSKKHYIHAGNYPFILKAVNNIKGTKDLSINMSAKKSDLDNMEKALDKNPSDKTVLDKLKMRFKI